jgi:hypothetical protein
VQKRISNQNLKLTQLLHGSGISSIPDVMVILPLLGFQSLIRENVEHHTNLRLALRD